MNILDRHAIERISREAKLQAEIYLGSSHARLDTIIPALRTGDFLLTVMESLPQQDQLQVPRGALLSAMLTAAGRAFSQEHPDTAATAKDGIEHLGARFRGYTKTPRVFSEFLIDTVLEMQSRQAHVWEPLAKVAPALLDHDPRLVVEFIAGLSSAQDDNDIACQTGELTRELMVACAGGSDDAGETAWVLYQLDCAIMDSEPLVDRGQFLASAISLVRNRVALGMG